MNDFKTIPVEINGVSYGFKAAKEIHGFYLEFEGPLKDLLGIGFLAVSGRSGDFYFINPTPEKHLVVSALSAAEANGRFS